MYIDHLTGEVKDSFDAWDYEERSDKKVLEINDSVNFPFQLSDLKCWMVRRKDGTTYKYQLAKQGTTAAGSATTPLPAHYQSSASTYASCHHDPAALPVYEYKNVQLFIADFAGARAHAKDFDVVIDGGNVLQAFYDSTKPSENYRGDKDLVALAKEYDVPPAQIGYRMLKIDWDDREAPPLYPHFWPQLADKLIELASDMDRPLKVLTVCYGGHGRSGSALVALMMCMSSYSPLDAITHLRAVHCARAIESKVQHEYLNWLGEVLGREQNALEAETVKSFKIRFMDEMTHDEAKPYQQRLATLPSTKEMPRDGK